MIAFDFSPVVQLGSVSICLETLALAWAIFLAIVAAGLIAGVMPLGPSEAPGASSIEDPPSDEPVEGLDSEVDEGAPTDQIPPSVSSAASEAVADRRLAPREIAHFSRIDLLIIVLSAVPGALVGGRLGYVLVHLDYYASHGDQWLDPQQGGLELAMAVLGGTLTGFLAARQLEGSVGRWLHLAALPLLVGLALGKLSMALGGSGQGLASDVPWATAYVGSGVWNSLAPALSAHPAQIYEALTTLFVLAILGTAIAVGGFRRQDGRAFAAAVGGWAVGRFVVGFTWRDPAIVGPLGPTQLVAAVVVLVCAAILVRGSRARLRANAAMA